MISKTELQAQLSLLKLWRNPSEVASSSVRILRTYASIAPLGRRLLELPPVWCEAYRELLSLFRHLAEELGNLRPEARCLLLSLGEEPRRPEEFCPKQESLLGTVIQKMDPLGPVTRLCEADRSLLPLHIAEIFQEAETSIQLATQLKSAEKPQELLPYLIWQLGASVEYHLVRNHIFDRSIEEPGLLSILDRLLMEATEA